MFNYNHLYYFYVTAKLGGISNAAKFLRISQPSLSSQVKVLESQLNKKLFEKHGRGLQLTPTGENTFAYCKKIFGLAEELSEALKSNSEKQQTRLNIGVSEQIERPFVADLISPILREKRNREDQVISVVSHPYDELLRQLRNQEIDLLLTNKPVYADDMQELITIDMPVNLLVSTQVLKAAKVKVTRQTSAAEFLRSTPWGLVIPNFRIKLRHEIDFFFQEIKTRKKIAFESDILSVVGRAILDGAGVGFLPTPYMYEEIKMGLITVIGPKAGYWKHSLYLIGRKENKDNNPMIQEVRKSIKLLEKMF
jgi:LysR family transcriptional activator of nhaA